MTCYPSSCDISDQEKASAMIAFETFLESDSELFLIMAAHSYRFSCESVLYCTPCVRPMLTQKTDVIRISSTISRIISAPVRFDLKGERIYDKKTTSARLSAVSLRIFPQRCRVATGVISQWAERLLCSWLRWAPRVQSVMPLQDSLGGS